MAEEKKINELVSELAEHNFIKIQAAGWHFQRNDYYSPLNDIKFLSENPDLWSEAREPAGIDWRIGEQLALAEEISPFLDELREIPETSEEPGRFYWNNNMWNNADALVQYGLVRARQPRRYLEVGCGWSSLLLRDALARNERTTEVTLIEPYPNPNLFPHFPGEWNVSASILQRAPRELFQQLEAGDFLFYDGSHCSKAGSDVNYFFFEVLPLIQTGVVIHIHDVFFPFNYPKEWIFERGQTWNEQYILQAFMMHNSAYRIMISNSYIAHYKDQEVRKLYKDIQAHWGSSFWIEKTATNRSERLGGY